MNGSRFVLRVVLIAGLFSGCAYFQKKDEPPPLPPIEETKPPLTLKGSYFKAFPWEELAKPMKDGNDPDTSTYTVKEGDTLDAIAERTMGDPALAAGLSAYNGLSSPSKVTPNEKIVIPNPIIGLSSRMMVKAAREKEFSDPKPFSTEIKKGEQYKFQFESNVNGYCYIFREGAGGVAMLYPDKLPTPETKPKPKPKGKEKGKPKEKESAQPASYREAKITAHDPLIIPAGKTGFNYDAKAVGDRVYVFLSLKKISALEDLKDKKKITVEDLRDVMHGVKLGDINKDDPPYSLLRISDPSEILGISLDLRVSSDTK